MRLQVQYQAQLADVHDEHIRALVSLALLCGWKRTGTAKGILLVAPDHKTVKIPENESLNANVYQSHLKSVLTHRDSNDHTPTACLVQQIIDEFKLNESYVFYLRKAGELPGRSRKGKVKKEPLPELPEIIVTAIPPEPAPKPEPVADVIAAEAGKAAAKKAAARTTVKVHGKVVKTERWNAHSGGGKETYRSHAVLTRTHEDGFVDYVCSKDGCTWSDENPRSVSAHHSSHTKAEGKGPVATAPRDGIDPDHEVNHRTESRIKMLAREIMAARDAAIDEGVTPTPEWMAEHIIGHRIVREDAAADITAIPEGEDLDDSTILDRIAALLDHGRGSPLKDLNEKVDKLTDTVTQQALDIETERKRADKAESNLKALREIVNELEEDEK